MLVLKGILLGLALSFIGTIVYLFVLLHFVMRVPLGVQWEISLDALRVFTIRQPLYWVGFVGMLAIGCIAVRRFRKT